MMSRMTTRPHVTPIMVRLVLSSVSRILGFLFSSLTNNIVGLQTQHMCYVGNVPRRLSRRTFAVIFIPWVNTVLNAIADQCVVDAHVAVTEESLSFTWSWKAKNKSHTAVKKKKHLVSKSDHS